MQLSNSPYQSVRVSQTHETIVKNIAIPLPQISHLVFCIEPRCTSSTLTSMRLLIIRHADPEYSVDGITAEGEEQANALADRLASGLESRITHLYTSPMGRACATAAPTAASLGLTPIIEEWTRELSDMPPLPGHPNMAVWDVSGADVRSDTLSVANQYDSPPWKDTPGVCARYQQLQTASDVFLARHGYVRHATAYYSSQPTRDVIGVFCHGGFGTAWLAHLLHIPVAQAFCSFYLAPSSLTTVLFDERGDGKICPRAIGVGDIGHLYARGLKMPNSKYEKKNIFGDWKRPSGIKANYN